MRKPYSYGLGLAAVLLTAAMASCSGGEDPPPPGVDAGSNGTEDSGTLPVDSGTPDAGVDAGVDSGTPDAGDDAGTPDAGPGLPDGSVVIPTSLADLGLFTGSPATGGLQPVQGNIPYELTTPLFSDYALKFRTLYIPPGKTAAYRANDLLDLPVGTLITKTFSFPADLREPEKNVRVIETRVLVRQPGGWEAYPYFWNAEQTAATLAVGGRVVRDIELIDEAGVTRKFDYLVPSKNQCSMCHHVLDSSQNQVLLPIGVKARYLNRDYVYGGQPANQLQYLADLGKLTGLPASNVPRAPDAFNPAEAELGLRARTYLDINCAHCHRENATAGDTSRMFLDLDSTATLNLNMGVCKRPGSAGSGVGGEFDIVPGDHSVSILWYRLHTEESGKMMPQIGRALRHDQGSSLIADWIDSMPARSCK
ncbi:SO2930 family diheme c-type cytochrome [Pyxidicoccus trucidator]|uniref:SO2930 family diheme c-type cytochrome n=1 Tax=Pyxidicoccus trucidator TaxID=2709662 RepID=UPI0013DC3DB5|nr:SO2930 family diheme c-type cytochrome [Pyxidicoccus trucidator]